jgi:hypothetical protein
MNPVLKLCCVLSLLGVLLSYNLDIDCILSGTPDCCYSSHQSVDDNCAEPLLGSNHIALLAISVFVFEVFLLEQEELNSAPHYEDIPPATSDRRPVGLRAPPAFILT